MQLRDIATMTVTAFCTATLALGLLVPSWVDAGADGAATAKVATPKLVASGIEVTLSRVNEDSANPLAPPEFRLVATNVTDQPATAAIETAMVSTPPANPAARMVSLPREAWQARQTLTLGPHETVTLTQATSAKLQEGGQTVVMLRAGAGVAMPVRSGVAMLTISGQPSYVLPVAGQIYRNGEAPAGFDARSLVVKAELVNESGEVSLGLKELPGPLGALFSQKRKTGVEAQVAPDGSFVFQNLARGSRYRFSLEDTSGAAHLTNAAYADQKPMSDPVRVMSDGIALQLQVGFSEKRTDVSAQEKFSSR